MKSLKLTLIAIVISFASASIAHADGFTTNPQAKKIVNLSIQQAVQNPDLVIAMYQQLDPVFLKSNQPYYSKDVVFQNYVVRITGTYEQWILFFHHKPNWE